MDETLLEYMIKQPSFSASMIIFIGYIFVSIQKITRLTYYKVDNVYLFEIRMAEIFLGVLYVFVLSLPICIAFMTHKILFTIMSSIMYILLIYCLNFKIIKNKYSILMLYYAVYTLIICFSVNYSKEYIKANILSLHLSSAILYIYSMLGLFMLLIILLQFIVEKYNDRFTYIQEGNAIYIIITRTEGNYITVKGKLEILENQNIIYIFRGKVKLIPIENKNIEVITSDKKIVL